MCKKESYIVGSALVAAVAVVLFVPMTGIAGSLEPSVAPAPTMKTLDQITPTWSQKLQCDTTACPRFQGVLAGGEGILDKETGLVWTRGISSDTVTWNLAVTYCLQRNDGQRWGWRLPTMEELFSLMDLLPGGIMGLPSGHPFLGVQATHGSFFWSASTQMGYPDQAWAVGLVDGSWTSPFKTTPLYMLCVRGGHGYDGY